MWNTGGSKMNVAVRVMAWATTNAQAQAPCQPEKVDEAAGCAVGEITVPYAANRQCKCSARKWPSLA